MGETVGDAVAVGWLVGVGVLVTVGELVGVVVCEGVLVSVGVLLGVVVLVVVGVAVGSASDWQAAVVMRSNNSKSMRRIAIKSDVFRSINR